MMHANKIAFVADVHLGNHKLFGGETKAGLNARFLAGLDVLGRAMAKAEEQGCDMFAVLGDLFDTHRPTPQMIAAVQQLFGVHGHKSMQIVLLAGNHDKSSEEPRDNALVALERVAEIVDDKPFLVHTDKANILFGPYRAGPAVPWVQEYAALLEKWHTPSVLATHVGLIDRRTPPWLQGAHDAIPFDLLGTGAHCMIVAGNWHEHADMGCSIQCGALVPTGFDNPSPGSGDPYGSLLIFDQSKFLKRIVVPGPRFHVRHFVELDGTPVSRLTGYLKIKADLSEMAVAQDLLQDMLDQHMIRGGLVEPCVEDEARVRKAGINAVLNSSSLDEALVAFLKKQQLPENVSMDQVAEVTRTYLKQGQKAAR